MATDLVPGTPGYLRENRRHPEILEVDRALAAGAHQVVVVTAGIAANVRVIAIGEVEPLHDTEARQDLERPKDCRSGSLDLAPAGVGHQVGPLEGPVAGADQIDDRASGIGGAVAGCVEGPDDVVDGGGVARRRSAHARQHSPATRPSLRLSLDLARWPRRERPGATSPIPPTR